MSNIMFVHSLYSGKMDKMAYICGSNGLARHMAIRVPCVQFIGVYTGLLKFSENFHICLSGVCAEVEV